jgi:hypothetical protein
VSQVEGEFFAKTLGFLLKMGDSFVWYNFTWNRDGPEYSDFNGKKIPSRVPLSTMLGGVLWRHHVTSFNFFVYM